ncbi:MAG: hypothetical protein ACKN9W_17945 [Methylococcus sp.]
MHTRPPYVHAVALKDAGQMRQPIRVLEAVLKRHPNDRDTLIVLALFERESARFGMCPTACRPWTRPVKRRRAWSGNTARATAEVRRA